ncbi:Uncharacterised protein [Mycobacterium tuberculosis]|nr:Uncharacterised protein [Mycobacterium tuberculosis]
MTYHRLSATAAPQKATKTRWEAIVLKPMSTLRRSSSGSGMVFKVGPKM